MDHRLYIGKILSLKRRMIDHSTVEDLHLIKLWSIHSDVIYMIVLPLVYI